MTDREALPQREGPPGRRFEGEGRPSRGTGRVSKGQKARDERRTSRGGDRRTFTGRDLERPGRHGGDQGSPFGSIVIYTDWNTGEEYTMATIGEFIKQARAAGYQGIGTGILDERFFEPGSDKVDRWLKFVKDMQSFQVEITGGLPDSQDLFRVDRDPSGGPGGGARGPVYQAPDRDAVEEFLQTFQVATTGQLEQGLLDQAVDSYLTTHRQDFDDKNQRHDPQVAAYNVIRNSTSYKDIHELRPESENEMQWVTGQQARLRMVGLNSEESQRLGIQLARVGANAEANKDAANQAFLGTTGRVAKDQRNSLKKSASAVLGLL